MGIVVKIVKSSASGACGGTGGLDCHISGQGATVSAIASATGGIRPGGLIETDRG
ncbi:MAG: hypothetical protein K2M69_05970 [Muribaculaceae bacterium]|nr:hypothetical protein [Muribaculaceae bacterium]